MLDKLEGCVQIYNPETKELRKKYENYEYTEHMTECRLVAKINRTK